MRVCSGEFTKLIFGSDEIIYHIGRERISSKVNMAIINMSRCSYTLFRASISAMGISS